jgi:putative hemolysin
MDTTKDYVPIEWLMDNFKIRRWLAKILMRIMWINKLNRFHKEELIPYDSYIEMFGKALVKRKISVDFDTSFLDTLENQAFFIICNHAFGFLDPTILISYIGKKRPNFKITTNYLLSTLDAAKDRMIPVNPFDKKKKRAMGGTKRVLDWIGQGHPVGIFPAGEVATYYKRSKEIADRPWSNSTFRLIRTAQIPVVPLFFEGTNSRMFHFLGRIHSYWRTFRLIKEFMKKKNTHVDVRVGEIVYPEEFNEYKTDDELKDFFRNKVYMLKR